MCVCVCVRACVCVLIESRWLCRRQRTPSKTKVEIEPSSITLAVTTRSFSRYVDEEFLSSGKVYRFARLNFRFYGNNRNSNQTDPVSIMAATNTCDMLTYNL
jgi:hypothetical protein